MVLPGSNSSRGQSVTPDSIIGLTTDPEMGEGERSSGERSVTPSAVSTADDLVPLHRKVNRYLAIMTGANLFHIPRDGWNVSSNTRELVVQASSPVDPITKAYIHEMTTVKLQFSGDLSHGSERVHSSSVRSFSNGDNDRHHARFNSLPSPSSTPKLESDSGSAASSSRAGSSGRSEIIDNLVVVDEDDPLPSDVRLELAAGFHDENRSSPTGDSVFSPDHLDFPIDGDSDSEDGQDRHLHASPVDREDSVSQEGHVSDDESVLRSIEDYGFQSENGEFFSNLNSPSVDEKEIIDDRTQRFLDRMTGVGPQKLQELWKDGTPPFRNEHWGGDAGSSDGENEGSTRSSTPEGLARIDSITRNFLRDMTGRSPQFVSLEDDRRFSSSHREMSAERVSSPDSNGQNGGGSLRPQEGSSASPQVSAGINEDGKRARSQESDSGSQSAKRLKRDGTALEASLSPEPGIASSPVLHSVEPLPVAHSPDRSPSSPSRPERDRSVGRG